MDETCTWCQCAPPILHLNLIDFVVSWYNTWTLRCPRWTTFFHLQFLPNADWMELNSDTFLHSLIQEGALFCMLSTKETFYSKIFHRCITHQTSMIFQKCCLLVLQMWCWINTIYQITSISYWFQWFNTINCGVIHRPISLYIDIPYTSKTILRFNHFLESYSHMT